MLAGPLALHWAIQVDNHWYEISPKNKSCNTNKITRNYGEVAGSGAGSLGGEIVGVTRKTDDEIDKWNEAWLLRNPEYNVMSDNCQKYCIELMIWLTDNNYRCEHRANAAVLETADRKMFAVDGFATAKGGNAIASFGVARTTLNGGPASVAATLGQINLQAVMGPGVGLFADASLARLEASFGNIVGLHADLNVNTGVGIRNGNVDAHLLGFGGKIGADGVEINTPVGGVNLCSLM